MTTIVIFYCSFFLNKENDSPALQTHVVVSSPIATSSLKVLPVVSILPLDIYPGDPIMVTVNASTSVSEIRFDSKKISIFDYKDKSRAFVAIPIEEKVLKHVVHVKLSNGMKLDKEITLTPREKIEKPLGIPEKLGGNTPEAGKVLVDNLSKENALINAITSSPTILWIKSFKAPLATLTITDPYGYSRDTVGYTITHKGTDFRAVEGTPVMAMNSGTVKVARLFTVYGNTIIIDHGLGVMTLYMHLSELKIKEGDKVQAGQVIGLSGKTGYAEAAHLHISIKINGVSIDPAIFMHFFGVI